MTRLFQLLRYWCCEKHYDPTQPWYARTVLSSVLTFLVMMPVGLFVLALVSTAVGLCVGPLFGIGPGETLHVQWFQVLQEYMRIGLVALLMWVFASWLAFLMIGGIVWPLSCWHGVYDTIYRSLSMVSVGVSVLLIIASVLHALFLVPLLGVAASRFVSKVPVSTFTDAGAVGIGLMVELMITLGIVIINCVCLSAYQCWKCCRKDLGVLERRQREHEEASFYDDDVDEEQPALRSNDESD